MSAAEREAEHGRTDEHVTPIDQPSEESRRQRDSPGGTGAYGLRTGESDLVFFEGILPENEAGVLSDYSIESQTEACLDRLESMLESRNTGLSDVMKVEIQLTEMASRSVVDDVYRERFDGRYPPRSTVGVCSLPGGAAIQLDVVAADE